MNEISTRSPMRTELVSPDNLTTNGPDGSQIIVEYIQPSDNEIAEYKNIQYPQWIFRCRKLLEKLHENKYHCNRPITLIWHASNIGNRPAQRVRVEFEAKGPISRRRSAKKDGEAEASDMGAVSQLTAIAPGQFPSPPKPPAFSKKITHVPAPSGASSLGGLQRANLNAGATRSDVFAKLDEQLKALRLATAGSSHLHSMLPGGVAPFVPEFVDNFRLAQLSKPRDPEAFYYDGWLPEQRIKVGALTCELWRHQSKTQTFEFIVEIARDGEATGSVECTVHAENLTSPVQSQVVVKRAIEKFDLREVTAMVLQSIKS